MLKYNPVTGERGESIAVGRAAVGIYLALLDIKNRFKSGKVIVPANICYAAIFPILSAGFKVTFCDVDKNSGNITLENISIVCNKETVVAIIPHMYGNPVKDLLQIANYLKQKKIILIEDCASLMTNEGEKFIPGTVGDYVIYSTGYSKTIDIGFGGILFSSRYTLKDVERKEHLLPDFNDSYEKDFNLFSRIYRLIRNENRQSQLVEDFYKSVRRSFGRKFMYSINETKKDRIFECIDNLDGVIANRRKQYQIYKNYFLNTKCEIYLYEKLAVPWRFNLLIHDQREEFIQYCLNNSLPVSDWYPCTSNMFGDNNIYPNALWHERHIVNFPLMIEEKRIVDICEVAVKFF